MFFRRNRKAPRPSLRSRLQLESLEGRVCPIGPIQPPGLNLDYVVNGESTSTNDDLVVVTPLAFSMVRVTHHVGQFHFDAQGNAVPDDGTTPTLLKNVVVNFANRRLVVNAGPGDDIVVNFSSRPCLLNGGDQNDKLFGWTGNDTIDGGSGEDFLEGRDGNDTMHGGSENDKIAGGDGRDDVYGNAGIDTLVGGASQTDNDDGDIDYLDGNTHFDGFTLRGDDGSLDLYFVEWFAPGGGADVRRDTLGTFITNQDVERRT
jgi:hypothetical protein